MNCFISTPAHVSSVVYYARGGYILGNATAFNTNGNDLIRNSGGNAVVVIIQYRLGVFGFLSGQKVKDGGALNAGLCKYEKRSLSPNTLFTGKQPSGSTVCIEVGPGTCTYFLYFRFFFPGFPTFKF